MPSWLTLLVTFEDIDGLTLVMTKTGVWTIGGESCRIGLIGSMRWSSMRYAFASSRMDAHALAFRTLPEAKDEL
jgi:hypothetical protein